MRDFEEMLDMFPGGKWHGKEYVCHCPCCESKHDHLYITQTENGDAQIYCHKCKANGSEVMAAIGKPSAFLFLKESRAPAADRPKPTPPTTQEPEKVYWEIAKRAKVNREKYLPLQRIHEYKDQTGATVFIKAVYRENGSPEKTCRWWRPVPGGYAMGTAGKLVPLYNAEALQNHSETVYVVEGEKDCDTMKDMGLVAVSSPNGGGQTTWDSSYSAALKGRDIVVITDNDETGEKYGKTVAAKLDGAAHSVKIVPAASIYPGIEKKGDISDIVELIGKEAAACRLQEAEDAQKHSATDLLFQLGSYTMDELTEDDLQPPEFIVDGMIPVGMTFLSGAPKTRKSFLALQLAEAVANGTDFLGHHTHKCSVLYFDLEGNKNRLAARTRSMGVQLPPTVHMLNEVPAKLAGDGEQDLVEMIRKIHRQHPEIRLVIIDTYSRARGTVKCNGSNAYDMDVQFLEPVQRMAQAEKLSLLFVHHDRKGASTNGDSLERLSGTMGISGSADSVLTLVAEGKRFEGKATLEYNPRDAQGGQMELSFDDLTTKWEPYTVPPDSIESSPIAKYFRDNAPAAGAAGVHMTYTEIVQKVFPGTIVDNPAKLVGDGLKPHLAELYMQFGIGFQLHVKSHGERGVRVYCSHCSR